MHLYSIDNLRNICILLLIPYHTLLIYSSLGFSYNLQGDVLPAVNPVLIFINLWIMPLMFVAAGMASRYSLAKRTEMEYGKERVLRLFIPFLCAFILLMPIQYYVRELSTGTYTGGFFSYVTTDLVPTMLGNTFDGGQLWFILWLFGISLLALPVMHWWTKKAEKTTVQRMDHMPVWLIVFVFFLPAFMFLAGNFLGTGLLSWLAETPVVDTFLISLVWMSAQRSYSFLMFFAFFILGYLVLSSPGVQNTLERCRFPLTCAAVAGIVLFGVMLVFVPLNSVLSEFGNVLAAGPVILAMIGLGKHYLEKHNRVTEYLSASSFTVYIFHQSWLLLIGWFVLLWIPNPLVQILIIIALTFVTTYLSYEAVKRFRVTRFMFGIKEPGKKSS